MLAKYRRTIKNILTSASAFKFHHQTFGQNAGLFLKNQMPKFSGRETMLAWLKSPMAGRIYCSYARRGTHRVKEADYTLYGESGWGRSRRG